MLKEPIRTRWPNKAFVPQSSIASAIKLIENAAIRIPIGSPRNGRIDGYVVVGINKADVITHDAGVGVRLSLFAEYEPDLVRAPWTNLQIPFAVDALLLPTSQKILDNTLVTYFTVLPISLAGFDVPVDDPGAVNGFLSQLNSASVLNILTTKLQIPVPTPRMSVDLSINSDSDVPMKDGNGDPVGNAILNFAMKRQPQNIEVLDRFVIASNGVWLLGGLPPKAIPIDPATGPAPSDAVLRQARCSAARF